VWPDVVTRASTRPTRRWPARLAGLVAAAAALLLVSAVPAEAHIAGTNASPSNYRTRVLGVVPPVQGLEVRVAEVGGTLELVNHTRQQVTVLGSSFEPYLRVGADGGVEENRRSPTWLASPPAGTPRPRSARVDAAAPPDWHRIGGGVRLVWHDHRAHWTGPDPPAVRQAPRRPQVVIPRWRVPLRVDDRTVLLTGEVVWIPGSSPWPWLAVAGGLAAAVGAAGQARRWRTPVAVALAVAVVGDVVHTIGAELASVVPVLVRVYVSSLWATAWVVGVVVAYRLVRGRDGEADGYLLLTVGLFFAFASGLGDVLTLSRSQVSTVLPLAAARATVTASLGLGVGLAAVGLQRLSRSDLGRSSGSTARPAG
jgi:hypothetical protein